MEYIEDNTNVYINYGRNVTHALTADTASVAISASLSENSKLLNSKDASEYAITGSNQFKGNQYTSGSVIVTGSLTTGNGAIAKLNYSYAQANGYRTVPGDAQYTRFVNKIFGIDINALQTASLFSLTLAEIFNQPQYSNLIFVTVRGTLRIDSQNDYSDLSFVAEYMIDDGAAFAIEIRTKDNSTSSVLGTLSLGGTSDLQLQIQNNLSEEGEAGRIYVSGTTLIEMISTGHA